MLRDLGSKAVSCSERNCAAECLAEAAVKEYLRGRGFEARPGLIDLGAAEPVRGTWEGLTLTPDPLPEGEGAQ